MDEVEFCELMIGERFFDPYSGDYFIKTSVHEAETDNGESDTFVQCEIVLKV